MLHTSHAHLIYQLAIERHAQSFHQESSMTIRCGGRLDNDMETRNHFRRI